MIHSWTNVILTDFRLCSMTHVHTVNYGAVSGDLLLPALQLSSFGSTSLCFRFLLILSQCGFPGMRELAHCRSHPPRRCVGRRSRESQPRSSCTEELPRPARRTSIPREQAHAHCDRQHCTTIRHVSQALNAHSERRFRRAPLRTDVRTGLCKKWPPPHGPTLTPAFLGM